MELRHLRYFVAVAEAQHFTRAAKALGMEQPPLSQQVQALEREIGTPLFKRLPRGVALTDAGHAFLEDARRILRDTDQATERARRVARGEHGRKRYPNVALTLDEGTTPSLAVAVRNETMDLAFVRPLLETDRSLCAEPLLDEEMLVALPSGHPLCARTRVPLLALSIEPFVLFPHAVGAGLHDEIIGACRNAGFSPRIVQETSQVTSIVNLVAAGLGVSIVPASMQQANIEGVTYRPIRSPAPKARLSLLYRQDDQDSPHLHNLLELTRQLVRASKSR